MFCWLVSLVLFLDVAAAVEDYHDPHCGDRQVIVHLFEWKWSDIALECEQYLGPKGFCGVQVSPANENVVVNNRWQQRPWWERYQPVSYKLVTRSGDRDQFKDMVDRCQAVGVRIYVDLVINHMAGLGRSGEGTAGSHFDSDAHDFPGVPFSREHFHTRAQCPSASGNVENYGDPIQARNCNLFFLTDLDGSQEYVQDKVADFINDLVGLGVAGFRVDAAKHMWPQDIRDIQAKVHDVPEGGRPFFYFEVIDFNGEIIKSRDYFEMGRVTEFRYVYKVKEGALDFGRYWGYGVYDPHYGMCPDDQALVFVDNHDKQRGGGSLTFREPAALKRASAFMLAYNYGFPRLMSSFIFNKFDDSPPHNEDYSTKDVHLPDGQCAEGWVCEHRWPALGNMVEFRNAVAGAPVDNFRTHGGVLSLNRGDRGFFAMGMENFSENIQTGLPEGEYCDLISECAMKVSVQADGSAQVAPANPDEPFVAIINSN